MAYSQNKVDEVIKLLNKGVAVKTISDMTGVPVPTIYYWGKKNGVTFRGRTGKMPKMPKTKKRDTILKMLPPKEPDIPPNIVFEDVSRPTRSLLNNNIDDLRIDELFETVSPRKEISKAEEFRKAQKADLIPRQCDEIDRGTLLNTAQKIVKLLSEENTRLKKKITPYNREKTLDKIAKILYLINKIKEHIELLSFPHKYDVSQIEDSIGSLNNIINACTALTRQGNGR